MNKRATQVLNPVLLAAAFLVGALAPWQPAQAQGFWVNYGEAHAAPDIGGTRINLRGGAMSACGVRYHLSPRREPPNRLIIDISTSLVVGGPGCNFVPVALGWVVPFAGLDDGNYEVVVRYTTPPVPVELHRFAFGMPVATGVPIGSRWTWGLLLLGVLAVSWRHRRRAPSR